MKFPMLFRAALSALLLCAGPPNIWSTPTEDGLYATFQISRAGSPVGEFSAKLEFENAPMTVANFVGLADGTFPFIDFRNGHIVQRKFYDGLTFHRVDKDPAPFVIQGGSPKGDGNDGPGYTFPDEFEPTLRHDKPGILSMANSGLNSNGSQFFVTLVATPGLDDAHNVFGEIVEGMDVVNNVQVGDVIESVLITRNGSAASDFDVTQHGLPVVVNVKSALQKFSSSTHLDYPRTPNSEEFVFHGSDIETWFLLDEKQIHGPSPESGMKDVSSTAIGKEQQYYTVARVEYADDIYTPPTLDGQQLVLSDVGSFSFTFKFDPDNGNTYSYADNDGTAGPWNINSYEWTQQAYRGRLIGDDIFNNPGFGFGNGPAVLANISFVFSSSTGGSYKGYFINAVSQRFLTSGTFVLNELP